MFERMLVWDKLPNSGKVLKIIIPNQGRKAFSGWSNYSGMVTSYKMSENEMGDRGSKSDFITSLRSVKEQRVDGSYFGSILKPKLRYTLMVFERNYQIKTPSKQLNIKNLSTIIKRTSNVNPCFWTGLIDAEGSFSILIIKRIKRSLGWSVELKFKIGLHKRVLLLRRPLLQYPYCINYRSI